MRLIKANFGTKIACFSDSRTKEFLCWSSRPSRVSLKEFDIPNFSDYDNLNTLLLVSKDL